MTDLRQMDDEGLDELATMLQDFGSYGWTSALGQRLQAEQARRAEIRMERGEYGEAHDAWWYNSRQTEEQWLAEVGYTEAAR